MSAINTTGSSSLSLGGVQFLDQVTVSGNALLTVRELCVKAQSSALSTRTNNTVGVLTMNNANHGLTNTQIVDLYWAGGQRRSMVAANVNGTSVGISGGYGTNLPVSNTNLNVGPCSIVNTSIVGANVVGIGFQATVTDGMFSLQTSAPAELIGQDLVLGQDYVWFNGSGVTNPITGNTVATIAVSTNNVNANTLVNGAVLYTG